MKLFRCITLLGCLLGFAPMLQAQQVCKSAIQASTPSGDFTDHGNGMVTHKRTGLMWQRCAVGQTWSAGTCTGNASGLLWSGALQAAVSARAGGYSDWRLPNIKELQSIVEEKCVAPSINESIFPNTPASRFWSASAYAGDSVSAWFVVFSLGYAGSYSKGHYSQVRLVRAGQSFSTFDTGSPEQTAPARLDLPIDATAATTGGSKAIVMTHGWNSDVMAWPVEMSKDLCSNAKIGVLVSTSTPAILDNRLSLMCQVKAPNNDLWDIWVLDWRTDAKKALPSFAYTKANPNGYALGQSLSSHNYSHIHFIAHSAGSNLIHSATKQLKYLDGKSNPPTLTIHETFLDAYDPWLGVTPYGDQADWADNYVDFRDVVPAKSFDGTKLILPNAFTVDTTPNVLLDPCLMLLDASSPWAVLASPADVIECRHNQPVRFYGRSMYSHFGDTMPAEWADPIAPNGTGSMGYPLSVENGHTPSALYKAYPKGKKCVMDSGTCYPGSLPPSALVYFPSAIAQTVVDTTVGTVNYVVGTGVTIFKTVKFGIDVASIVLPLISGQTRTLAMSYTPTIQTTSLASVAAPVEPPSVMSVQVTTTQPVNTMRFNWQFAAAGEGYLRVFVNDNLVREIDQRHVPLASSAVEEVYVGGADGMLPAGTHRIAFRLDGFAASASGVALSDVELGVASVLPANNLSVAPGWNLLGNSLDQALPMTPTFADQSLVTTVWKWDAPKAGWQFYAPSMDAATLQTYATSKGYDVLSVINPGEGYWVNAAQATTLGNQSGTAFALTAANLQTGWNLVATGIDVSPSAFNLSLSATPPAAGIIPLNLTSLWAWDNLLSQWYFYSPTLEANGGLGDYAAGKGYLDFGISGKTLGNGVGFWVNKP